MSFNAPFELLWLLPLVGSLVLLYFLRPRRQNWKVSSLLLWSGLAAESRSAQPFQRLKVTLLLFLQLLTLILLCTALASPVSAPKRALQSDFVIILDLSASMEATDDGLSRIEEAKTKAALFAANLKAGERIAVIGAGAVPTLLCSLTDDRARIVQAVRNAHPDDVESSISSALALARTVAPLDRSIRLYTDCVWSASDRSADLAAIGHAQVEVERIGSIHPVNVGIVGMSLRTNTSDASETGKLLITIARTNSTPAVLTVDRGGRVLMRETVAGGSGTIERFCSFDPSHSALITAALSGMSRDDLAVDNKAIIDYHGGGRRSVLLVTDGNPYLERALSLMPNTDLYEVSPTEYAGSIGSCDIAVFDRWLPAYLPDVPLLVFEAVNSAMPVVSTSVSDPTQQIVDWDSGDPLLNFVDLTDVHLRTPINVRLAPWGSAVADLRLGPAIAVGTSNGRKIVWTAFSTQDSDFATNPAFPIFLTNVVESLVPSRADLDQTGEPILLPVSPGGWKVVSPNGTVTTPTCSVDTACVDSDTLQSGVYSARSAGRTVTFARNIGSPIVSSLEAADISTSSLPTFGGQHSRDVLERLDLISWFTAAALAMIIIESLVYNRPLRYTESI